MRYRFGLLAAAVVVMSVQVACGGTTSSPSQTPVSTSTPSASSSSSPATASPTAGDQGCQSVSVYGQTTNAALQAVATQVYQSLNCAASQPLVAQLEAAQKNPEVVSKTKAAGGQVSGQAAGGGYGLQFQTTQLPVSFCQVIALDSPVKGKSLSCGDA